MRFIQTHAFDYHRVASADPAKRVVRDEREFWDVIRYLERFPSLGYDVETSGTAYFKHARICGSAFGVRNPDGPGTLSWYFPFRHQTGERQLPEHVVLQGMRILLENRRIEKVCHNGKFERHMARADGIEIIGPMRDTMIEAHLYDENYFVGLKERVSRDLGDPTLRAHEIVLEGVLKERAREVRMGIREYKDNYGYAQVPVELCGVYACHDVDGTLRLGDFYDSRGVRQFFAQTYSTEIELSEVLFEMEEYGVPVDVAYLNSLREQTQAAMQHLAPQVFAACGYSFNIGSDDELRHTLIHRLGAQLTKRTKGYNAFDADPFADDDEGTLAVDKEVLEQLAPQFPVCATILEWRQAQKISSTYTDSILKRIDARHILHGDFKQIGTTTGRLSAEKPNMQNFAGDSDKRALAFSGKKLEDGGVDPWSVKRAFVNRAPENGVELCCGYFDYSQIELRVLAQYSADPTMLDVYAKGEDIHNRTSLEVFDTLEKAMRRHAKVINFGLSYCMSAAGFARQAKIPLPDAEKHMAKFFQKYPRIAPFREEFWAYVAANGGSFMNLFGRPRRVPGILSGDKRLRARSQRQTIGSLVQGTAAELTKISLVRLFHWERRNRAGLRLRSTIHDEISADMPFRDRVEIGRAVKHIMEDFRDVFTLVPIETDAEYSTTNWSEKKKLKLTEEKHAA